MSDSTPAVTSRLDSIDLWRGLIICLMVLDHTRDFIHRDAFIFDPLDLSRTTPILFLTRWITHLCAPTFVFLSGVSIFLQSRAGKTGWTLSRFLLTRGLWLIFLELTVVNLGFDLWPGVFLQVIWAIGFGMIVMAGLVHLPRLWVLGIGAAIVSGHHVFDAIHPDQLKGPAQVLWTLLMQPGPLPFLQGFVLYPALPWLGIMCLGYGLGDLYTDPAPGRTRNLAILAGGCLVLFVILRLVNHYGDPTPWTVPQTSGLVPLAFIAVAKYPPSLDYVLLMLGLSTGLFLALPHLPKKMQIPLLAFGRTSMLTYLLHIFVAHILAVIVGVAQGVPAQAFFRHFSDPSRVTEHHFGLPLWGVYLTWLTVLLILYPVSSAWARHRMTHRAWWHSYL